MQLVFGKYKSLSWTSWKKSRILVGEMFWNSWLSQFILSLTDTCRNIIFVTPFGVIVETPSAFCQLVILWLVLRTRRLDSIFRHKKSSWTQVVHFINSKVPTFISSKHKMKQNKWYLNELLGQVKKNTCFSSGFL